MDLSTPHINRKDIESLIGMRICDVSLYQNAFVHRSVHKYFKLVDRETIQEYMLKSNERVEFLGDLALSLIVGEYLYTRFPHKEEGELTIMKANLVKKKTLATVASKMDLNKYLLMGAHVASGVTINLLENVFECLMGAIYLDLGFDAAKSFWHGVKEKYINDSVMLKDKNYKDIITKYCQSNKCTLEFRVIKTEGPPHNPIFFIELYIDDVLHGNGNGKQKISGEQNASKIAVENFIKRGIMSPDVKMVKKKKLNNIN